MHSANIFYAFAASAPQHGWLLAYPYKLLKNAFLLF